MIAYLKHNEIDKKKWNTCILASANAKVYVLAEYLDIVSPGWSALVENDYEAVFPVITASKFFINYMYQPPFTKFFDVYTPGINIDTESWEKALHKPFRKVPLASVHIDSPLVSSSSNYSNTLSIQELNLSSNYNETAAKYTKNVQKNLKKASKHVLLLDENTSLHDFVTLKRKNYRHQVSKLHLDMLVNILGDTHPWKSNIVGIKNDHEEYILISTSVIFKDRLYFISSGATAEARNKKAKFVMYDHIIRKYSGANFTIDFMGSNIPNVAYFNHSFGAVDKKFFHIEKKGWLAKLKKLSGK